MALVILSVPQCRPVFPMYSKVSYFNNNNNEFYLHDHRNTYSIAKPMFRNQNYTQGNYVALIIICHEHQNKLKFIL